MHGGISPHQVLLGKKPGVEFLKCFGCTCYPLIHNKLRNNFEPKTSKCVFLGYSNQHKGNNYFNLDNKKLYISRNVKFNEMEYSFLNTTEISSKSEPEKQFPIVLPPLRVKDTFVKII